MENNDPGLDAFRKKIREDLRNEAGLNKNFQQRLTSELPLIGMILAVLAILIFAAFFYFKHVAEYDALEELSTLFVPWLFSCLGSQCP